MGTSIVILQFSGGGGGGGPIVPLCFNEIFPIVHYLVCTFSRLMRYWKTDECAWKRCKHLAIETQRD